MSDRVIKVLVVEDSVVVRALLVSILNSDPRLRVIGAAANGCEALAMLARQAPNVIVMDIDMPEMDGFETTRRVMETQPVPIIVCSASRNPRETMTTFRSMEAGAVACIEKPVGPEHKDFCAAAQNLLQTVMLMSEVRVVRRWSRVRVDASPTSTVPNGNGRNKSPTLIGIGASTGGPPVLQAILAGLPKDFAASILIVQHIATGFLPGLVEWLNQTTGVKVHIAAYGEQPLPGHVYLAPDEYHLSANNNGHLSLSKSEPENGLRPAVGHLFRSLGEVCGASAIAVLLTGMGRDGADELKTLKDLGATTIVQDRESCVVFGMPGEAIALGAACHVLPPERIAFALANCVAQRSLRGQS